MTSPNLINSVIYYTGDAHHILGFGDLAVLGQAPGYLQALRLRLRRRTLAEYWFGGVEVDALHCTAGEMGRDRGYHRMSNYTIHAVCATLTNAGFGDWFSTEDSGVPNWAERMVFAESSNTLLS